LVEEFFSANPIWRTAAALFLLKVIV